MLSHTTPFLRPEPLQPGSKIAIVSPAGIARIPDVEVAAECMRNQGWQPIIMPHALGRTGSFSGSAAERLCDLTEALLNPEIKAILCSRGGYGAVHLLDSLSKIDLRSAAKYLIGFSDISALHALLSAAGIMSIHGPMAKHIAVNKGNNPEFKSLCSLLRGNPMHHSFDPHPLNRTGSATARLSGGNLAVLSGLVNTPFDALRPGTILFIEDIAEPIYKVERMLWQLKLSGVLENLAGLITGTFTNYQPDANYSSMEQMIARLTDGYSYPRAMGIPIGHGSHALPLLLGSQTTLSVTPQGVSLINP